MISSMRDLERTWNRKFNYPWTFFNDVPFDDDFKRLVKLETKAKVNFGKAARPSSTLFRWCAESWIGRGHTERALGCPIMDQQRFI